MKGHMNKQHECFAEKEAHYKDTDINDKLIINLRDISHTMRFLYEGKGSQKRILIVLNEIDGSITQRELTKRLGIQPGSASEVIAKLENEGFVMRLPNETDRRTTDVTLTEAGKAAADQAKGDRDDRHEQMFSCLSETEKDQLLSLLEKVRADWEKRYQDRCETGHHHSGHGHHMNMERRE